MHAKRCTIFCHALFNEYWRLHTFDVQKVENIYKVTFSYQVKFSIWNTNLKLCYTHRDNRSGISSFLIRTSFLSSFCQFCKDFLFAKTQDLLFVRFFLFGASPINGADVLLCCSWVNTWAQWTHGLCCDIWSHSQSQMITDDCWIFLGKLKSEVEVERNQETFFLPGSISSFVWNSLLLCFPQLFRMFLWHMYMQKPFFLSTSTLNCQLKESRASCLAMDWTDILVKMETRHTNQRRTIARAEGHTGMLLSDLIAADWCQTVPYLQNDLLNAQRLSVRIQPSIYLEYLSTGAWSRA